MRLRDFLWPLWDALMDAVGLAAVREPVHFAVEDDEVTLDITAYRQAESFTCGVAAGLTVLHTFHPQADAGEFYHMAAPDSLWGLDTPQLKKALKHFGVGMRVRKNLRWGSIVRAIDSGEPVITCIKTGEPDELHWVVVYGYGQSPKRLFVAGRGLAFMMDNIVTWDDFQEEWEPRGFGIVCWGEH